MKVLHVYKTYLPDNFQGTARVIWEIAEGTRSFGIESEVLSLSASPEPPTIEVGGHLSHRARQDLHIASTSLSLAAFGRFRQLAQRADLIHYHFPWPMMDLLHLVAAPQRPSIVTYHSDVVRQKALGRLYAPVMHRFLRGMDRIIATSPNYRDSSPVLQRYGDKVEVIPIGIGPAAAVAPARMAEWRERLGSRFLLFVGALRYYKGLPFLLEAARITGFPVVLVGSGEMADEIERSRPSNVVVLGEVAETDKDALLSLCDAFVFPSHLRSEAFGVALLEAARAGKAMVTCEIGTGTSYINIDGETGLIVPPADAQALAAAMQGLWTNQARTLEMGRRAQARYVTLFTAERMAAEYVRRYRAWGA